MVVKADTRKFCELLDTFKVHQKGVMNQWAIILIVNEALNAIVNEALNAVAKTNVWAKSFVSAYFCPSQCKPLLNGSQSTRELLMPQTSSSNLEQASMMQCLIAGKI